jgi:hypothetical protein
MVPKRVRRQIGGKLFDGWSYRRAQVALALWASLLPLSIYLAASTVHAIGHDLFSWFTQSWSVGAKSGFAFALWAAPPVLFTLAITGLAISSGPKDLDAMPDLDRSEPGYAEARLKRIRFFAIARKIGRFADQLVHPRSSRRS